MNHSVDDYSECDTVITSLIQLKDGSGVSSPSCPCRNPPARSNCLTHPLTYRTRLTLHRISQFIGSHLKHLAFFPNPTKPTQPFPSSTITKRTSQPLEGSKAFEIPPKYFQAGEDGVHRFNDGAADAKGRLWSVSNRGSGGDGRLGKGGC